MIHYTLPTQYHVVQSLNSASWFDICGFISYTKKVGGQLRKALQFWGYIRVSLFCQSLHQ